MEIFEILEKHPIIPVLVFDDLRDAVSIVEALEAGGIQGIEVTLRTPIALEVIHCLRRKFPKLTIGAGTILTQDQMIAAQEAGAHFGVSPGFAEALSLAARKLNFPYLPGAITPSEIMAARRLAHRCLKYFPAQYVGGIDALKALKHVFPDVMFCPTGGVGRSNFKDYLALDNVISVGGSWLVTLNEVQKKDWGVITRAVQSTLESL